MDPNEFRLRAERGEIPTVDPRLQTAARSGNYRAQREMQQQIASQQQDQAREQERAMREQEALAEAAAKEQAREIERQRARDVRAAAAAGAEIETDIETGRRSVKLHPDGTPVSKAGPVGDPKITTVEPQGPMPGTGAPQAPVTQVTQRYRNDRFQEIEAPVEPETDKQTGERYVETKDEFGRPARTVVGVDPDAQKKLALETESAQLDIAKNNLAAQKLQNQDRWKSVSDEWSTAQQDYNKPPKYRQENGKWIESATGYQVGENDPAVRDWRAYQAGIRSKYDAAKRRFEEVEPAMRNLEAQERQIALRKLEIDTERTRLEHGLPSAASTTAQSITADQTGELTPAQKEVVAALATVPGFGAALTLGDQPEAPQPRPLIPADDAGKLALLSQAFQGIQNPEQFTIGQSGDGYTFIQRDGQNIMSIDADRETGEPAIVLNDNLQQNADIKQIVAFGGTGGTPIYLREGSGARSQRKENAYVASVFQAFKADPTLGEDQDRAQATLAALGADPASIYRKVATGDLSVQRGEELMQGIYGATLKADDPLQPATFEKWLGAADQDTRQKWAVAAGQRDTEGQNAIKREYLNEWFVANRMKPGVTLATRRLAEQALLKEQRGGEKAAAFGSAIAEGGGSMLGMMGAPIMLAQLRTLAALGDTDAAAAESAAYQNYGRASKNVWRGLEGNRERMLTAEGKAKVSTLNEAFSALRSHIATQDNYPTGIEDPEWKAGYKAALDRVTDAQLGVHDLNQEAGWNVTRDDIDPSKNPSIASMINGYALTGDSTLLDAYRDAISTDHGTRQATAYMTELTAGASPFMAGIIAGSQAPPEEIGMEIISAVGTGILGKALFGGAKAANLAKVAGEATGAVVRTNRFRRFALSALEDYKKLGMVEDSLANPASALGRAQNAVTKAAKVAIPSAISEGPIEEGTMALADPNLTPETWMRDSAMGALLGVIAAPVIGAPAVIAQNSREAYQRAQIAGNYAAKYNRAMAGTPGFRALTAKDAETVISLLDPARKEQAVAAAQTAARNLISAVEAAAGPNPAPEAADALSRAQEASLKAQNDLALLVAEPTEAVASLQSVAAEKRDFARAVLKVASGHPELLTPQERSAASAQVTQDGQPYFAYVNGQDVITDAGRVDALRTMPAIGKLIRTTDSQAMAEAQFAQAAGEPAPVSAEATTAGQSGPNMVRLPVSPETAARAARITERVRQTIGQKSPGIAKRTFTAKAGKYVTGGVAQMANQRTGEQEILIIPDDIAQLIEIDPAVTDDQIAAKLEDDITLHEITHVAQMMEAASAGRAKGYQGNDAAIAKRVFEERHSEFGPALLEVGKELYARNSISGAEGFGNWTNIDKWMQAAEIERMFVEAILEGRTTDANRFLSAATAAVRKYLLDLAQRVVDAIRSGLASFTTADGRKIDIEISAELRARAERVAEIVRQLKANAPDNQNASTADPGNRPSQPPASQAGAGNSPAPEGSGNQPAPGNGGTEPAPGDDAGAPAAPELTEERKAALKTARDAFHAAIGKKPILKKDPALIASLEEVAYDLAEQIEPLPAAGQAKAATAAIDAFLASDEIAGLIADLYAAEEAKKKEARMRAFKRISAEADRIIASRMNWIRKMDDAGIRINLPPNVLGLFRWRRADNLPLNQNQIETLNRFKGGEWDAIPRQSEYPGGGRNAVVREIVRRITAPYGYGRDPDQAAGDLEKPMGHPVTTDEMIQAIAAELRGYAYSTEQNNFPDPDAELTDEQIEEVLKKSRAQDIVDRWQFATKSYHLSRSDAFRMQEVFAKLVDEAGYTIDPIDQVVDAFNDLIPADELAAMERQAIEAVRPKKPETPANPTPTSTGETREQLDAVVTEGSQAPLNPRVEGLEGQSVLRGDLSGKTAPLATADLQAIQRNGSGITALFTDGSTKRAVDAFVAKAESMMPLFQGNKIQMAKYVASAILRYWTKAQREAVTTFYDMFAGGGAWGLVLADAFFPNVKKFVINEFNTPRSIKVREQMVNGHHFAEVIRNEDTQIIIRGILQDYYARSRGVSWGGIYDQFEKWAEQNAGKFDDTTVAIIKMLADDSTLSAPAAWGDLTEEDGKELDGTPIMKKRGPNAGEITNWFLGRHALWAETIHQTYQRMTDRGVTFTFRNGDAYTMDVERGKHVFVAADPPYFATTGYDGSIVKPGMYAATRNLMRRLVGQDNNVAYTDEAWFIKNKIVDKITDADIIEGAEIATQIAKTLDLMVVAGKIESRYETLGLHNPAGSPVAPGRTANPDGDAGRPDGGNLQQEGRGPDGRGAAGDVAAGPVGEAGIQPAAAEDGLTPEDRDELRRMGLGSPAAAPLRPLVPENAFGEWSASAKEPGILIGYRGERHDTSRITYPPQDNNFGGSEGIGLYIAKLERDAEFFGNTREVKFQEPKRPIIVDEDGGRDTIPLLNEEEEVIWQRIFSHQTREGDSDWIKAHVLAAKQIGLTEDTWVDKIDEMPRALTDKLLAMGYDAVYVRSGGMEWVNLLAKKGQRFHRGTKSEGGTALYSAPAQRMADPRQLAFEFRKEPSEYLLDMEQVDSQPLSDAAKKKAYATLRATLADWIDIDSDTPNLSYIDEVRKYLGTSQEPAAAVWSYITAGFTDMATMPDHPASKAFQRALALFPDSKPKRMIRGLGFPSQAAAMAYVRDFKPGNIAVQSRQFASWSAADQSWEETEGYDLPAIMSKQHGEYSVTLRVTPGVPAKDISAATTGGDWHRGVELVTQKGTQMRVKSVERDGKNWIVYMEGLSRPSKQSQALFSAPAQNPAAEYRYLKAKQEKAGLTPAENEALLRAEAAMGQTFAFDMDREKLRAPRGTVANRFQPFLRLETATYDANGNVIPLSQRFNPQSDSILYSPAFQKSTEDALAVLDPIYREVFRASQESPTPSPDALAARFGVSARAIDNILGTVRARLRAVSEAAEPGGLQPKPDTGRPDLGYSTVPSLQRIDQIRAEEGLSNQAPTAEIRNQAEAYLRQPNAVQNLIANDGVWNPVETAAASIELVNRALANDTTPETALLAQIYREQGSRWSEAGRARQDVHMSPAEREAMLIHGLVADPDARVAAALKKAKTAQEKQALLEKWEARVKGIKETLKARGIDIEAAMSRFARQRADATAAPAEASQRHQQLVDELRRQLKEAEINLKQAEDAAQEAVDAAYKAKAEAEKARAEKARQEAADAVAKAQELDPANTIRLELRKLPKPHRIVIETMHQGGTWQNAADRTGMSIQEARRVMLGFIGALEKAATEAALMAEEMLLGQQALGSPSPLASSPADNRAQRAARIGKAVVSAMGYDMAAFDRRGRTTTTTSTSKKSGAAARKDRPEPAMMSDAEFARYQNNPDTHRAIYQWEMAVARPQNRITFDEWMAKPQTKAHMERQARMFSQPVSTTTGTLDMHDPSSVRAAAREWAMLTATPLQKVVDYWRMAILTGPQTAIVNTASNVMHSLYHVGPRRLLEAGINDVLGLFGAGDASSATLGEFAAMSRQIHRALALAGQNMLKSWNSESRIAESMFTQNYQQHDLGGLKGEDNPPALGGPLGTIIRTLSYRHMTAADEFIKAFHGQLEAAAQAHRIAKAEKLKGKEYATRIEELMKFGSKAWANALAVTEDITFQRKLDPKDPRSLAMLDKLGSAIKRGTHKYRALAFFFPFVNTPTNIFKAAIEMSPIGGLLAVLDGARALKIRYASGNLTEAQAKMAASELYDRARLVRDLTNQILAAGVFWALSGMVEADDDDESGLPRITGTVDWKATRKGERDNQYRTMPPMSIRLGDGTIVSYARVEPFATMLAGVVDLIHELNVSGGVNDKLLGAYFGRIQNQLTDKTFLAGVSDLIKAAQDPERFTTKLAGGIVTGFVPNLIRQPIREADPVLRDASPRTEDGFFTAIGKQLGYSLAPGYAPPQIDVWGNPVTRHQGEMLGTPTTDVVIRVFDPSNIAIGKEIDPVDLYIFNWNARTDVKAHLALEPIRDHVLVTRGGQTVKIPLTPEEQAEANRRAGKAAREFLGNEWDWKVPTQDGIDRIKETVQRFQKIERDRLRAKKLAQMPQ